ncbi:MAG: DUF4112 domain-containing protein [Cyanobacteria bacterium P01_A01_bin.68]
MDTKASLPLHIEAYEKDLLQTKSEIQKFVHLSEGIIFGQIGIDALVGVLPGAGGLYTGIAGIWLLLQAYKVRAKAQEKLQIIFLTGADLVVGVFPVFGDILDTFLRVHAWNGNHLIAHIDKQIVLIERTREQLNQGYHPDLNALDNILLGKGKLK